MTPLTLATIIGGPILLAWWWRHEWHRADPLIQVRLFAQRPILIANGCFALAGLGVMHLPLVMMQFLQQPVETGTGLGISATVSGILKLALRAYRRPARRPVRRVARRRGLGSTYPVPRQSVADHGHHDPRRCRFDDAARRSPI